ncbi:MAG TPA: hypothetical protein PKW80_09040 [Bacteroidales bacterium]|nr:hypothetical protein [Bacteroidales bacterium]
MKTRITALISALLCLFFVSCRKTDPSWEINVNAPLLKSTMGLGNILPDSLLEVNNDHSLSLIYKYPFYNFSLDSLLDLPDTLSHKYLPPLAGFVIHAGQTFLNLTENSNLGIHNAQISRVDFRKGMLALEVFSSFTEAIIVTYDIPSASINGAPFHATELIPAATPGSVLHFEKFYDISGYSLDLRGPAGLSSNILTNTTTATLHPAGGNYTLDSLDEFRFNVRFKDISLQYAKGFFGSENFSFGPDTTSIDIFDKITAGTFDFESIKLHLNVENGFGVDAQVIFNNITSINSKTGHSVSLDAPVIGQSINISRATETGNPGEPVNPSAYNIILDNSNVLDLIENIPDMISYKVQVESNPLGNISCGNDFFYYGNYLNAALDMEIPLSLIANDLTLTDTVDFDLGENSGSIISGTLSLLADNGFPFSAQIQLYTLDSTNHITDSLLFLDLISPPPMNAYYMVTHPRRSVLQIPLPENKISLLYQTRKMLIVARFNTIGAGHYVKIYDHYKLDLKLTGNFNYLIKT